MQIVVIKNNLKEGVSSVEKIAGENHSLPILKNVLIDASANKIKLTTTNLELAITHHLAGKVIKTGKTTAPASIVSGIVNNLQTERINLEKKENSGFLEIKTDNYEATVQVLPAEEFPITPKIENSSQYLEIKGAVLKNALIKTIIATQFSDFRPELNSVFFSFSENEFKLAATDSFRLAEATIEKNRYNTTNKEKTNILVPLKTINELIRLLKDEDVVKIHQDNNQVLFKTQQTEILSRLIEGSFPDYEAIIPKKFSTEIVVNRQEFMSALKLVGVFGSRGGEVKFKARENKKVLEISSSDQAAGENKYLLTTKLQNKLEEIIFNRRYLIDALKIMDGEEVFLGINGEAEPAALKQVGDGSYIYVLKPITA